MNARLVLLCGLVATAACSSPSTHSQGTSQQRDTASPATLKGAWVSTDFLLTGLQLNDDGTFVRDSARVLNGTVSPGGTFADHDQKTGTFDVGDRVFTLSFDDGSSEVYAYVFTPAIFNGIYKPGHEPKAHLDLTQQPAKGSNVAYPTLHFTRELSFCYTSDECVSEQASGIWSAPAGTGSPKCDATTNRCVMPGDTTTGGSDCEVEEGGTCVDSADACTGMGGQVSGNNCDGAASGGSVCCDLPQ